MGPGTLDSGPVVWQWWLRWTVCLNVWNLCLWTLKLRLIWITWSAWHRMCCLGGPRNNTACMHARSQRRNLSHTVTTSRLPYQGSPQKGKMFMCRTPSRIMTPDVPGSMVKQVGVTPSPTTGLRLRDTWHSTTCTLSPRTSSAVTQCQCHYPCLHLQKYMLCNKVYISCF